MNHVPAHARRPSTFGRLLRTVVPQVRRIHAQVAPYARLWDESNTTALAVEGPLWVVLGDSTAQGIGAPTYDQGYVGQLRHRLDAERGQRRRWRVLNWSRSGARTADLLHDQLPLLEALDVTPDLVTLAIGANDVYRTPLDDHLAHLRSVIVRLPAGAVVATMPQGLRPQKAAMVNDFVKTQAPALGLVVADVWARTGPPWRGKFASDQFHPGPLGYQDWADAFAEALGLPVSAPAPVPPDLAR